MSNSLVDVVDENNCLVGASKPMFKAHENGLWHRVAHVIVHNSNGNVLLQLRNNNTLVFPSFWDVSCAGHVDAGEKPVQAALRELEEELSLKVSESELKFFRIFKETLDVKNLKVKEFAYVYFLRFDGSVNELVLQEDEVVDAGFFSVGKIKSFLNTGELRIVPHKDYWLKVLGEVGGL